MPTYVYRCQSCGTRFEAWQKISDEPLTQCPNCAGEVHRVVFAPALSFKGSGFYITDNKGGSSAASPAPSEGESTSAGTSDTKAPSKPEVAAPASSGD